MEPVRGLDHFRLPLASHAEAVLLLATLLRDGPQTSEALASTLKWNGIEVSRQINALYRAAYIDRVSSDLWGPSQLGEMVLSGLRIVEVAAADIAQSLFHRPIDRQFAKHWISRPSTSPNNLARLSLLRSLTQFYSLREVHSMNISDSGPLVCAAIIATDPGAHFAGVESIADEIRIVFDSRSLADKGTSKDVNQAKESVASMWKEGMRKYFESNRILLLLGHQKPTNTDDDVYLLTAIRAINASLGNSADEGFLASCRSWRFDEVSSFWKSLLNHEAVGAYTHNLCEMRIGNRKLTRDSLYRDLCDKLWKAIESAERSVTESPRNDLEEVREFRFERLLSAIRIGCQRLREDGVKSVSTSLRVPLHEAALTLTELLDLPRKKKRRK